MRTGIFSLFIVALLVIAPAAYGDNSSLDNGISSAVKDYKKGGVDALLDASSACYPANYRDTDNSSKVDFCVAYDLAANQILQKAHRPIPAYLQPVAMLVRVSDAAEKAGFFHDPRGLDDYIDSRSNYVIARVPAKP